MVVNDEANGIIEMREPSESWKANIFWGLLFGLLLIVPSFFAPEDVPVWKKFGLMFLGVAWLTFMGRKALQNRGRKIRCDEVSIVVSQPFDSRTILLAQVKTVTRNDVRKQFREMNDVGRSRYKTKGLDTMPEIVMYSLRDAAGHELLRLDKNMEPGTEMRRFLDRMEKLTGSPIREE